MDLAKKGSENTHEPKAVATPPPPCPTPPHHPPTPRPTPAEFRGRPGADGSAPRSLRRETSEPEDSGRGVRLSTSRGRVLWAG